MMKLAILITIMPIVIAVVIAVGISLGIHLIHAVGQMGDSVIDKVNEIHEGTN